MNRCFRFVFLGLQLLLVLLILGACSTWGPFSTEVPGRFEIDENDKVCVSAKDCTLAWTDCSSCECGTPINQQYVAKYEQKYKETCANYRGPVCEMSCPEVQLDCIDNLCVAVEKE